MNKYLIIIGLILCSCSGVKINGYIVGKEYTPGHMCHDEVTTYREAGIVNYVHVPITPHHHTWQKASFIIHIANSWDLRQIDVDSLTYINVKVGSKYHYDSELNVLRKIK